MAEDIARVCFASTNPAHDGLNEAESVKQAIAENPRNASLTIPVGPGPMPAPGGPLELAMYTAKFWKPGSTLRVRFLTGNDWQKGKVKEVAPRWCQYGNIKFQFIDSGECEILIDFKPNRSWSYIGTDSKYHADQNEASMDLGWIDNGRSEADLAQVILHEFGHALGAVHEHESPYASIPWNKPAVYASLGRLPNNWDAATVDRNMFTLYTLDMVQATPFDPLSIMLYYYPPSWTLDGKGTSYNTALSALDKAYIKFCYPQDTLDAGQFNTMEVRPWDKPQLQNTLLKTFQKKYSTQPRIALALNWLDMDCSANYRITAVATNITTTNFTAGLDAWADSVLYSAGVSYLELGPDFDYIQTGIFNTQEVRAWNSPQATNSKRINFSKPFTSGAPRVVCWINALDYDHEKNCRVTVFASDIDANGFTANINSWADSVMYSAGMTWIAYPIDQPGVASGTYNTSDISPSNQPCWGNSGIVSLGGTFSNTPKLIVGLNALDYDCTKNLRIRNSVSSVTQSQFVWHLQSWADSVMYMASASWFAWT